MDPIYTYQNTVRIINFSIDIPAVAPADAQQNLINIKQLQTLLYPTYQNSEGSNSLVISTSPLFQIKFANLISDPDAPGGFLMGVIPSVNFKPGLDSGMFYESGTFLPKLIQLDITFKPIHQGVSGFLQGSNGFLRTVENAELQIGSNPGSGAPPNGADHGVPISSEEVAMSTTEGQMGLS